MNPLILEVLLGGLLLLVMGSTALIILCCRHEWVALVEREFPAKLEELHKTGMTIDSGSAKMLKEMMSKILISIIQCKKCGSVKKWEVRS